MDHNLTSSTTTTRQNLPRELDFLHEAENAEKARTQLSHFKEGIPINNKKNIKWFFR